MDWAPVVSYTRDDGDLFKVLITFLIPMGRWAEFEVCHVTSSKDDVEDNGHPRQAAILDTKSLVVK